MSNYFTEQFSSRSITGKLTLIYSISAFGLLLLASFILYMALIKSINKENIQFLNNEVSIIRGVLKQQPANIAFLEEEIPWNPKSSSIEKNHYYCRIIDATGRVLIETPGMKQLLPMSNIPLPIKDVTAEPQSFEIKSTFGNAFLLMTVWANIDQDNTKHRVIQIALDITNEKHIIDNYRRDLLFILLLGIFGSAGIGTIIARRGLQPVNNIAKKIEQITVDRLDQRLIPQLWPDELQTMANSLNQLLERLESSFQRLSLFSSDLAHELRTPICNLMGEAEITLNKPRSEKEYKQVLQSSLEEYARLSKMIERLLFLARSENPHHQINRELIGLPEAFDILCDYHGITAEEQGVELICRGQANIFADPLLFNQAISNLIVNSLRHTQKGDRIIIDAKQLNNYNVQITVSDTGSGIAQEHIAHVFNRFYRADPARSKKFGGAGLGLAIVKSIVELHHGEITIQSDLGKGTTLILIFPGELNNLIRVD